MGRLQVPLYPGILFQLCHSWGFGLVFSYCTWTFLEGGDNHKQPYFSRGKREVYASRIQMWNPSVGLLLTWFQSHSYTLASHIAKPWPITVVKSIGQGFPGGAVVESPPANAGDTGSSPGLGGSHMPWSSWARGPRLLSLRVWSLCLAAGEAAMVRGPRTAMKSGPRSPQLEKALAQKRRSNTAKNKKIN